VLDNEDKKVAPFIASIRSRNAPASRIETPKERSNGGADGAVEVEGPPRGPPAFIEGLSIERLEELSNMPDIDAAHLFEEERRLFMRAVASGALSSFVDTWVPWWRVENSKRAVEELSDDPSAEPAPTLHHLRTRLINLPDFSTVSARPASPLMRYLVADVLFSYCRALRAFNGTWAVDAPGAASLILSGSPVLYLDARHCSMTDVVEKCLVAALSLQSVAGAGPLFELSFFEDVLCILKERELVSCAIADAREVLLAAREQKASKKLLFFLLWSNGAGAHNFSAAADELLPAWQASLERVEVSRSGDADRSNLETQAPTNHRISAAGSRQLVQEIPASERGKP
jgi:hypothetical protein